MPRGLVWQRCRNAVRFENIVFFTGQSAKNIANLIFEVKGENGLGLVESFSLTLIAYK